MSHHPPSARVVVFGGTGFLGSRVARELTAAGLAVRAAARRPERAAAIEGVEAVRADVRDAPSVDAAMRGCRAAVNAVGLYAEAGRETFAAVHVDGAARVAATARRLALRRLVHVSGIGADPASASPYIRARGEGERAVRKAFEGAVICRPAVMFGRGDAFLGTIEALIRRLPVVPLFGRGTTRMQPVRVDDVAAAVARIAATEAWRAGVWEFGGPTVYAYRDLLEVVMRHVGTVRPCVPLPFALWKVAAAAAAILPNPPLTEGQVALMRRPTTAAPDLPGLAQAGVRARTLEAFLAEADGRAGAGRPTAMETQRAELRNARGEKEDER